MDRQGFFWQHGIMRKLLFLVLIAGYICSCSDSEAAETAVVFQNRQEAELWQKIMIEETNSPSRPEKSALLADKAVLEYRKRAGGF